ncbi:HMG1/2-like protein [Nymphaea thermarum]|nr:HMG1/2-like protein [Nymphaea thermarum]
MKNTKADRKRSDSDRNLKAVKKQKTGKPKKPPTAYFVFLEEFREKYKRDNPNVKGVTAVVKACGAKWRSMSEQEAGDGSGEKSDSGPEQSGDEEED